jgi:putative Holliday junction resolvase
LSRILAIDFGERRIGLALSDTLGITAQGLPTLDTRKTRDIFTYIENIIKENDVTKVIVGMPKNMNGTIGPKGREVKKFIQELVKRTKMEVIPWDERLTTVQSLKTMREMGTKQKHKEVTDRISATLILQSYLDSAKHEASWRRLNDLPKENET